MMTRARSAAGRRDEEGSAMPRKQAKNVLRLAPLLAAIAAGAGCASLAPLAVKFGADLISSASANYSQRYASKVQDLMQGVYSKAVQKVQPQQTASADSYAGAYPQTSSAYPSSGAYPSGNAYPAPSDPYGSTQASTQSPYPSSAYPSTTQSPYPSAQASPYPSAYGSSAIVLDATILAQRASDRAARRTDPTPIQDGDTLRDGGSDPRKGDVIKVSFRVNCDCYVYVIGADATGYIARIFPDPASGQNPVRANQQYVVPQGTTWYGLDQYKGVEQVFFVASRAPRQDIEGPLSQLAETPRTAPPPNYRGVREAAADATRGLVKVQMGTPSTVQSESGQRFSFTPQSFASQGGADDVVVTRWFNHQ
jgi:hypothetical protein